MHKFMMALDQKIVSDLQRVATDRNISVQELLRAIIVPEWFGSGNSGHQRTSKGVVAGEEGRLVVSSP